MTAGRSSLDALVRGDFNALAAALRRVGLDARVSDHAVMQVTPAQPPHARLLLSVGVHGDETAPLELLAGLLDELLEAPNGLALELMVMVGNPAAVAAGKRFVEVDLNRMFRADRGMPAGSAEAARADVLMRAAGNFFAAGQEGAGARWHLDLHTAIRASHYPTFAVVPDVMTAEQRERLLAWLAHAGIGAAILNTGATGTFSAWSATMLGAASATLELGRVAVLGGNDLGRFVATAAALRVLLRDAAPASDGAVPDLFRVVQELRKHSPAFRPRFGPDAPNFMPFEPGSLIAEDGEIAYRAGNETEYVVFPNPDVQPGFRAGLMVVRVG